LNPPSFYLSIYFNLLYKMLVFNYFWGKFFGKVENGQKKCPKNEKVKTVLQKTCHESIIEIYGLVTEKIFFNLLR
jgi:phenylalanine-4-hydroxylase